MTDAISDDVLVRPDFDALKTLALAMQAWVEGGGRLLNREEKRTLAIGTLILIAYARAAATRIKELERENVQWRLIHRPEAGDHHSSDFLALTARAEKAETERDALREERCDLCGHVRREHDDEWCNICVPDSGANPDPDHIFLPQTLREERDEWALHHQTAVSEVRDAQRENARLREALRRLVDGSLGPCRLVNCECSRAEDCGWQKARALLSATREGTTEP